MSTLQTKWPAIVLVVVLWIALGTLAYYGIWWPLIVLLVLGGISGVGAFIAMGAMRASGGGGPSEKSSRD